MGRSVRRLPHNAHKALLFSRPAGVRPVVRHPRLSSPTCEAASRRGSSRIDIAGWPFTLSVVLPGGCRLAPGLKLKMLPAAEMLHTRAAAQEFSMPGQVSEAQTDSILPAPSTAAVSCQFIAVKIKQGHPVPYCSTFQLHNYRTR